MQLYIYTAVFLHGERVPYKTLHARYGTSRYTSSKNHARWKGFKYFPKKQCKTSNNENPFVLRNSHYKNISVLLQNKNKIKISVK